MQQDGELMTAAFAHYRARRLRQADKAARQALEQRPDAADALHLLGLIADCMGKREETLAYLRRAVDLDPNNAWLRADLGMKCAAAGKTQEALNHYREALALDPDPDCDYEKLGVLLLEVGGVEEAIAAFLRARDRHANCAHLYNHLGVALATQGKMGEAIEAYRQALQFSPDFPDAHNNLGIALFEQGQLDAAIACFHDALKHKPDHADAFYNLGLVHYRLGRVGEAIAAYREALRLRPDFTKAHVNVGAALVEENDLTVGIAHFQSALGLDPHMAIIHSNLASALLDQGRLGECIAHCEEALCLDPSTAAAYVLLGELSEYEHYCLTSEQMEQMHTLLAEANHTLEEGSALHFTLGSLLHKQGCYEEAFGHFRQGNELKSQRFQQSNCCYDPEKHVHFIDSLIATFTCDFFDRVQSFGLETELPIFVVGMPRSGTTLVHQILASHPHVLGAGELRDLEQILVTAPEAAAVAGGYPAYMTTIGQKALRDIGQRYLDCLAELGSGALRVVDKMPPNYFHLGVIAALFPQARIIHCQREAMDVCFSCFIQNFKWYTFTSRLEDVGWHYRQYERIMAHWRAVLPVHMFDIQYEALVSRPESNIRQLLDFCGLEWSDSCLVFHEKAGAVQTASRLQVRQPIYTTSIDRWKSHEKFLGPLREILTSARNTSSIKEAMDTEITRAVVTPSC